MLYKHLCIGKVVCLGCGAKVGVDQLIVVDVDKIDTMPEKIKAKGAFFQILCCPICKNSVYLGFIAEEGGMFNKVAQQQAAIVDTNADVIDIGDEEPDLPPTPQAPLKTSVKRHDDGTLNLTKPTKRLKQRTAVCTQCNKEYNVGTQDMGGFGSKCKECLNKLVSK